MKVHNYQDETRSLLERLTKAGFTLTEASDEDWTKLPANPRDAVDMALGILTACDESHLAVSKDGCSYTLWLVYGNGPGELVCDYGWKKSYEDSPSHKLLEETIDKHFDFWENWPTRW